MRLCTICEEEPPDKSDKRMYRSFCKECNRVRRFLSAFHDQFQRNRGRGVGSRDPAFWAQNSPIYEKRTRIFDET